MPDRHPHRITAPLIPIVFLTVFSLLTLSAWASTGEVIGYPDSSDAFVSVCRVAKKNSLITVTKINPGDKFKSVELQFVFPGADEPKAMKGIFIQWEKGPGVIGNPRSVPTHRSFDKNRTVLRTPWKRSNSFRIVDKSASQWFRELPWEQILRISVNGRTLVRHRDQTAAVEQARKRAVSLTDRLGGAPRRTPTQAGDKRALDLMIARIASTQKQIESEQQKLLEKVSKLENTVHSVQKSLAVTSKWYYWGPLISLALSIVFTSVTLFLAFTRLSPGRGFRNVSSAGPMRTRDKLNGRFRIR